MEDLHKSVDLYKIRDSLRSEISKAYICKIGFYKNVGCLPIRKKVGMSDIFWQSDNVLDNSVSPRVESER